MPTKPMSNSALRDANAHSQTVQVVILSAKPSATKKAAEFRGFSFTNK